MVALFLLSREDAADGLSAKNPKSDILGRVVDLAEDALSDACRKKKSPRLRWHISSVRQNLDNESPNMSAQLKDATHAKQVSTESLVQAEKDLALEIKIHDEVEYRDASEAVKED